MRKAVMYLLLALGICLVVAFAGGALIGFAAGFIDGFNGDAPGTSSDSKNVYVSSAMVLVILVCLILNVVFLSLGYAKYTVGIVPRNKRWQVVVWLLLSMGGLAFLHCSMYNPIADSDDAVSSSFLWIKENVAISLPYLVLIEATGDLIIFGGILREILEWKHRPQIVISVFAIIMGLFSALFSSPLLFIPAMMQALLEGYVYEYSRSVIAVIIGDAFYWVVMLCLMGTTFPWWCLIIAGSLILIGSYFVIHTMEPYKPID